MQLSAERLQDHLAEVLASRHTEFVVVEVPVLEHRARIEAALEAALTSQQALKDQEGPTGLAQLRLGHQGDLLTMVPSTRSMAPKPHGL